jgi:acyl-CoA thioesterase-1
MINRAFVLMFLLTSLSYAADPVPPTPIRVACVGDSITQGPGHPKGITYPDQLQQILGAGYQVQNFGLGGCTLLRNGNKPYWKFNKLQKAQEFKPNVVIIMLGTNDSKPQNWVHESEFLPDYRDMVKLFQGLDTKPRIFLCHVPTVIEPNKYKISETNSVVIDQRVDALAKETGLEVIPMDQAYGNDLSVLKVNNDVIPPINNDNVHPNKHGAFELAQTVAKALTAAHPPTPTAAATCFCGTLSDPAIL